MKAIWHDTILAESTNTKMVEDKHYFPPDSINSEFFQLSDTHSTSNLGRASYFHIQVGEDNNPDAAWFYPYPEGEGSQIRNYVTFGKGVEFKD